MSWARISAILEGFVCCGSLGITSLSAAFFRQLDHRLIVLNHIFSCVIMPMELRLSHMKRMGIGRPPAYPYLVLVSCSDGAWGPSCWGFVAEKMVNNGLSVVRRWPANRKP